MNAELKTRTGEEVEEVMPNGAIVRRRKEMGHSPTGKARAKITLMDFQVRLMNSANQVTLEDVIYGVPSRTDAIREFVLKYSLDSSTVRFQSVTPIDGSERDAGEEGYSAAHTQRDEQRARRVEPEKVEAVKPKGDDGPLPDYRV